MTGIYKPSHNSEPGLQIPFVRANIYSSFIKLYYNTINIIIQRLDMQLVSVSPQLLYMLNWRVDTIH